MHKSKNKSTDEVLLGMLLENTGKHFLDSGGESGRAWQRNNAKGEQAIKDAPASTVEFSSHSRTLRSSEWEMLGCECEVTKGHHRIGNKPTEMQGHNCTKTKAWEIGPAKWLRDIDTEHNQLEINVTHSVYHWLRERVDFDSELDEMFQQYADGPSCPATCPASEVGGNERGKLPACTCGNEAKRDQMGREGWLVLMQGFVERLQSDEHEAGCATLKCSDPECGDPADCTGGGGECDCILKRGQAQLECVGGGNAPMVVNTYNGEDLLSQTLQYALWEMEDGDEYILLQIHGGADVRGGYTRPRLFRASTEDYSILDNARASIYCTNPECKDKYGQSTNWSTDDGCHWYEGGACGTGYKQLETHPAVEFDAATSVTCARQNAPHAKHAHDVEGQDDALCSFLEEMTPFQFAADEERHEGEDPVVVVGKKAVCPICHNGWLEAGFY